MNAYETRKYEMLVRVRDFGGTHGTLFPKAILAAEAFDEVGAAVKALGQHAVSKMSAKRDSVRARAAARNQLRGALDAIHQTAGVVAATTPGVEGKFRMPEGQTDQALITAGRLFARDAEPFSAAFLARAMPKTFITDGTALVEKLEAAIQACEVDRQQRATARVNIREAMAKGGAAAHSLDVIVTNHLRDDPAGLAAWEVARRIDLPRTTRKPAAAAPEPAATNVATEQKVA